MAEFYDITSWNEKPWFGTKGSRSKSVVENPQTGVFCYFKTSLHKPNKDYKYEYWSEIIASEVGRYLGFNVLKYEIAFYKNEIGCISEFMNTEGESELTEGIQYLTGYNTAYNPTDKESKKEYTFDFIHKALKAFDFDKYIHEIIKIIIFDSLIGNGDRHQENWGIITYNKKASRFYFKEAKNKSNSYYYRILLFLVGIAFEHFPQVSKRIIIRLHSLMPNKFAPIYDSGSCLGREILDDKVSLFLKDENRLLAYIKRGPSEIHWENEKLSHFELIRKIKQLYPEIIKEEIQNVKLLFNEEAISKIVERIDINLPSNLSQYKLPQERKNLIIKMISLRYKELIKILD